jgi:probable HAF family extracellular repeat protein
MMTGITKQTRVFFVLLGLVATTLRGSAEDQSARVRIVDLGPLDAISGSAIALNERDQVVGTSFIAGNLGANAFLWTRDEGMTDLGTLGGTAIRPMAVGPQGWIVGSSVLNGLAQRAFLWTRRSGMIDLGTLGRAPSAAFGVNGMGQVIGQSQTPTNWPHAFWWTFDEGMVDIGTLPGDLASTAAALNAHGQVVGSSGQGGNTKALIWPRAHAISWTRSEGLVDIGTLPGDSSSAAVAVNDSGQVAGTSFTPRLSAMHAFLWTVSSGLMDLGNLGQPLTNVTAMNAAGHVVGQGVTANGENHAFLWTPADGMIDLGTFGGTYSTAAAVNNRGQVVGTSALPGDREFHAFLWTRSEGMIDLGTLGGSFTVANAINDRGHAVGISALPGDQRTHAVMWSVVHHSEDDEKASVR